MVVREEMRSDLPCTLKPRLQLRPRNSMGTKCCFQVFFNSCHPSRNIDSNRLVILVLEAILDVVSPVGLRAAGMARQRICTTMSCLDVTWSWVDFIELENAVRLKNPVSSLVIVRLRHGLRTVKTYRRTSSRKVL